MVMPRNSWHIPLPQPFTNHVVGCHNRGLSVLTGDDAVVDLLFIVAPIVVYARQYILKTLSGFGCCLFSQAMMLWLLIYC